MDNTKKITVIVATYNRCENVRDVLGSLSKQDFNDRFDYEVIIVDNNSKDRTKEIVNEYQAHFNNNLRYIFEPKQGKSNALNTGIKTATGAIIAVTDDDCIVSHDWLIKINDYFSGNPEVDVVLGEVTLPEGQKIYTKNDILRGNGMNMCFRKKIFDEVGYFDFYLGAGSIGDSAEETEFIYRAQKKRKKIAICENIKIVHKHRINEKQRLEFLYRDAKGYVIFWLKYVLKERDLYALKKIYWYISGFFVDLLKNIRKKKRSGIMTDFYLLKGCFVGLIKGMYIWLIFEPLKSLCQKSV